MKGKGSGKHNVQVRLSDGRNKADRGFVEGVGKMVALCEDQAEMTGRQTQNGRGARNGGTFTFKPKSLYFPIKVYIRVSAEGII